MLRYLLGCLLICTAVWLSGCDMARDIRAAINSDETASLFESDPIRPLFALVPANLQAKVDSAEPMMAEVLRAAACVPADDDQAKRIRLQKFAAPSSYAFDFKPPKASMRHNNDLCLTLTAINQWGETAANTLSFTAEFLSRSSQETASRDFVLERQANGAWLAKF